MTPDQVAKARHIFGDAIEAPPQDRPDLLTRACGNDRELRARVESLLQAYERGKDFLQQPTVSAAGNAHRFDSAATTPTGEHTGTIIGPYVLQHIIGEGGFGTVFEAEQQRPLKRRVAFKVIKAGMDTRAVIARFDAERAALALMDHPNIARVLDAGATTTGRPYFVMELVAGTPLTQYCDEKNLPMRQRLELFITICQAVQHAHQKGIIHRDLKPSNVLVSEVDGKPLAKVIDFGIAKATEQEAAERSVFTQTGQMIGTPLYMSPEQAGGAVSDVDTRSDIYSLGVMLYELLTGTTPFDAKTLKSAGFSEIVRIIREVEPPRPSARIGALGAPADTIALHRRTQSRQLSQSVRGDLDWIVMKCLEKDRSRRYESISALAQDVQHYLSDEPVSAGPPSKVYRLKKFARRNKGPVAAAAIVLLALTGGTIGTSLGLFRANVAKKAESERAEGERRQKETAEKRLVQIQKSNEILTSIFSQLDPRLEEKEDKSLRVQLGERLDQAANDLQGETVGDPMTVASLQMTLGNAQLSLGRADKAIILFGRARETFTQKFAPHDPLVLTAMARLAAAYMDAGKMDLAIPLCEETLKIRSTVLGEDHPDTLTSMGDLAGAYHEVGKLKEALDLNKEVLRRAQAKLGPEDPMTLTCMNNLAAAYGGSGNFARAVPLYEEALKITAAKRGPAHYDTLTLMNNLAAAYIEMGDLEKGLSLSEKTLELCKTNLGVDHPMTLACMNGLATAYLAQGNPGLAIQTLEKNIALAEAKLGSGHRYTLNSQHNLARAYIESGNLKQGVPLLEKTLEVMKEKLGPDHRNTLTCMDTLAGAYLASGKPEEAKELFTQTLDLMKMKLGKDHVLTLGCMTNLAHAYAASGDIKQAISLSEKALTAQQAALGQEHPLTLQTMNNLAAAYAEGERFKDAIPLLNVTLQLDRKKYGMEHIATLNATKNLALIYQRDHQPDDAIPLFKLLYGVQKSKLGADDPQTMETMYSLAAASQEAEKLSDVPPLFEELLRLQKSKLGPENDKTLTTLNNLAFTYYSLDPKRLDRSIPLFKEALETNLKVHGPDNIGTLTAMTNLGVNYCENKEPQKGIPLLQEAFDRTEKLPGSVSPGTMLWIRKELELRKPSAPATAPAH
jgi:serine/threonine protein kinase/lipopolysaccharide biosynthesis regulator YciM